MQTLKVKKIWLAVFGVLVMSFSPRFAFSQPAGEVIRSGDFVAFGCFPGSGEMQYRCSNVGNRSVPQIVENHLSYIRSNHERTSRRS